MSILALQFELNLNSFKFLIWAIPCAENFNKRGVQMKSLKIISTKKNQSQVICQISVPVTFETKNKVKSLKKKFGKSVNAKFRDFIEELIRENGL